MQFLEKYYTNNVFYWGFCDKTTQISKWLGTGEVFNPLYYDALK